MFRLRCAFLGGHLYSSGSLPFSQLLRNLLVMVLEWINMSVKMAALSHNIELLSREKLHNYHPANVPWVVDTLRNPKKKKKRVFFEGLAPPITNQSQRWVVAYWRASLIKIPNFKANGSERMNNDRLLDLLEAKSDGAKWKRGWWLGLGQKKKIRKMKRIFLYPSVLIRLIYEPIALKALD